MSKTLDKSGFVFARITRDEALRSRRASYTGTEIKVANVTEPTRKAAMKVAKKVATDLGLQWRPKVWQLDELNWCWQVTQDWLNVIQVLEEGDKKWYLAYGSLDQREFRAERKTTTAAVNCITKNVYAHYKYVKDAMSNLFKV